MIIVFISFVKVSCLALLISDASSMAGYAFISGRNVIGWVVDLSLSVCFMHALLKIIIQGGV